MWVDGGIPGGDSLATIYDLKPKFQALLRPAAASLAGAGVTANGVTTAALLLSVAQGALLALAPGAALPLLVLPVTLFVRMALNAIDGSWPRSMTRRVPRRRAQRAVGRHRRRGPLSALRAYPGVNASLVVLVVVAGIIAEMAGALGPLIRAPRRYDGPLGKSDRAFAFGLLAVLIGIGFAPGPGRASISPLCWRCRP